MEIYLPTSFVEWLPLAVPIATLLVGLAYLLVPQRILAERHQDNQAVAIGQIRAGRILAAGPLIGSALAAILLQQPVVQFLLALAWGITGLGFLSNEPSLRREAARAGAGKAVAANRIILAGCIILGLGAAAFARSPELAWFSPAGLAGWLTFAGAIAAVAIGLAAIIVPGTLINLVGGPTPADQPRLAQGTIAGFWIAGGLTLLASGNIFLILLIGANWTFTTIATLVSLALERPFDLRRPIIGLLALMFAFAALDTVFS